MDNVLEHIHEEEKVEVNDENDGQEQVLNQNVQAQE